MTARNAICFAALSLASVIGATGCVHTELVGFDDHASKPLTAMRVKKDTSYGFWSSQEYVFYSCAESGDKLSCKRLCGGATDVVCPMTVDNGYRASNNIR
jgi:hypothetical protein